MNNEPIPPQQKTGRRPDGKFAPGNCANPRGRIPGSRNKATLTAQALLDGEVENLTRRAVELALDGDVTALRLCLERILPAKRENPLPPVNLPTVSSVQDLPLLTEAILQAVAAGELTPSEGQGLASLVSIYGKALELCELEQRISALEERAGQSGRR